MAKQAADVADAAPAVDPEWLRALADKYGLTDERRAELEAMLAAIPWADPERAALQWIRTELAGGHVDDGLHNEYDHQQRHGEHPEEYGNISAYHVARFLLKMRRKGIVSSGRPPACMRPVARSRERRSPRRSVRRASCRARSPGRKPKDPDPHHVSAGGAR
jgi:hypothetical protein